MANVPGVLILLNLIILMLLIIIILTGEVAGTQSV